MAITSLIALLCFAQNNTSAGSLPPSTRIYFIGNSVTDTVNYRALADLSSLQGRPLIWGRHMIPGAPISWLYNHQEGFSEEPFGPSIKALKDFLWDFVSLQPFDRHLDGEEGDVTVGSKFIKLAFAKNSSATVLVYQRWPRVTSNGKGLEFEANDYDPKKPGTGFDVTRADSWEGRYLAKYTGGWDGTNETQDYFSQVKSGLQKQFPAQASQFKLVPVGDAMLNLDRKMRAGKVKGYKSIYQLYRDAIHLGQGGSYLVGLTFYAVIYKKTPVGLPTGEYGNLDPVLKAAIQESVKAATGL